MEEGEKEGGWWSINIFWKDCMLINLIDEYRYVQKSY